MTIGLELSGTIGNPAFKSGGLQAIDRWFKESSELLGASWIADEGTDYAGLYLDFHPAASLVRISCDSPNKVAVSADTIHVGPGYHLYLCELLLAFGKDAEVEWLRPDEEDDEPADESGYFFGGEASAVYELFRDWLQRTARQCHMHLHVHGFVPESDNGPPAYLPLYFPLQRHDFLYQAPPGIVGTALGPRDEEWLDSVVQDPEKGSDAFPWWHGGFDAYHAGKAAFLMWNRVRWRPPADDDERFILREIKVALAKAKELGASTPVPAALEAEIDGYLAGDEPVEAGRDGTSGSSIGYFRQPVRFSRRNLSIEVPGSFAFKWRGDNKWAAWDSLGSIHVTIYPQEQPCDIDGFDARCRELLPDTGEEVGFERGDELIARGRFELVTKKGNTYWRLQALYLTEWTVFSATIIAMNEQDRDWAYSTFESARTYEVWTIGFYQDCELFRLGSRTPVA